MQTPSSLGQRIAHKRREKAFREGRDVQQTDLAEAAAVSKAAISRYERDIDVPRERVLERIAAFLHTSPGWLRYGGDEAMFTVGALSFPVSSAVNKTAETEARREPRKSEEPKPARKRRTNNDRR